MRGIDAIMVKRINAETIIALLLLIAIIFILNPVEYKVNENGVFLLKNTHVLSTELLKNKDEIADIRKQIEANKNKIKEYKDGFKESDYIINLLNEDINDIETYCGMTDLRGKGIMIRIADNMENTGGNFNLDIVHDIDIAVIINDLRDAGAEAIAINGKRIINSTEIICAGPLIRINGKGVAAPFVIKAIGDADVLSDAIYSLDSYAYTLMNEYGIKISTIRSNDILIPKHQETVEYKYVYSVEESW